MNRINWSKATLKEYAIAKKIAKRANEIRYLGKVNPMSLQMDIVATHISGCKLKLQELLKAELFDFAHDIIGIMHHLDRDTGQLQDCFIPRYAK